MRKRLSSLLVVVFALVALSCGQVITPAPTDTPVVALPSATPTATDTPRPTFTLVPMTPMPTFTPTATPTPVLYTVKPGDTLLAIAAQFGVSVRSIQEANGIIDPHRLQLGQVLIIPAPQDESPVSSPPTPTPLPLEVQKVSFQRTPVEGLWALGEVYNPGTVPVTNVFVQVILLDREGQPLAAAGGYLQLDVVPPRQAVAFAVHFTDPPAHFAQYQVSVLSGVPYTPEMGYHFDLLVSDMRGEVLSATTYRVSGQLRNAGDNDAVHVRVLVIGYDDQGRVVAVRQAPLDVAILRAAAITPFQVDLIMKDSPVVTYAVRAQGQLPP
ncbi:MAG: LysM peptidoglycan-binding domain-containing protein [Anaerolineae bacterium]|nr:LysM peptidoglycan-binding domain-containing protein [Anaerolineae bacterium]